MEGPPEQPAPKQESQPASYERALELFKRLRATGADMDADSPEVLEAQDALDAWEGEAGLVMGGIGGLERAKELVRGARMLLDAGFTGKGTKADVRERLDDLHSMATREDDAEATAYIVAELEKLAPKNELEQVVESKLAEAAAARPIDAVGILTGVLVGLKYKRLSPEQRARMEQARDEYSAKWKAERAAKK